MNTEANSAKPGADTRLDAEVNYALTTGYGYRYVENVFGERLWVKVNSAKHLLAIREVGLDEYVTDYVRESSSSTNPNQE